MVPGFEAAECRQEPLFMSRVLLEMPYPSDFFNYFKDLVHWPPQSTSDAGELILVVTTLAISMGIMVIVGEWWSR
jgi:hypothetical protein